MLPFGLIACAPPAPPPRHAVVVVIDTLRADVVAEVSTPVLDALATEGHAAQVAWSPGTWTVPSVISMFTGMSVRTHGWDLPAANIGAYPMIPAAPTLAQVLNDSGFHTTGLVANPYLSEPLGFDRGFDTWARVADAQVPARLAREVAGWSPERREFVYVHLLGPHSPLDPTPDALVRHGVRPDEIPPRGLDLGAAARGDTPGVRGTYQAAYRAAVEDTDALLGRVLDALAPVRAQTMVVVTSDHGELLGEHGIFGHGRHVWSPLTHVPLVVAGGPAPPPVLGAVLVPDLVTRGLGVAHRWPESVDAPLPLVSQREGQVALSEDGVVRAVWATGRPVEVFDLASDPGELRPLPGPEREAARARWEAARPSGASALGAPTAVLHPSTIAELAALGYLEESP
jgi:arylsulfatase A-like enzyme